MNKKIYVAVAVFIAIFISLVVYYLIPRSYIVFKTAPEQVTVLINGKDKKNIKNGDKMTVSPGSYKISVFKDEFNPYNSNITIKNGETIEIVAALTPLTDYARSLINNKDSNYVIEKATAIRMEEEIRLLKELNPIMNILPIENRNYSINSCASKLFPNDKNKIALCVDIPLEDAKIFVKEDIRSRGYNPDDYEYIWNNYLSEVE